MSRKPEPRILFSCVTDSSPECLPVVENLVFSLRQFGGSCRDAPFVVNFVGHVPDTAARALSELCAEARCVEPMLGRDTANKLRMLELHQSFSFDVLVALDCETVVLSDPRPHIPVSAIGAKPVDYDPLSRGDWRRLYRAMGIPIPTPKIRATSSGSEITPCFNSGVLTVPGALCRQFQREWSSAHLQMAAALGGDSHVIPRHLHYFEDQVSLALCMARSSLPFVPLPVVMNFPTHVPVHDSALSGHSPALILHYYDAVDDRGFLYRPQSPIGAEGAEAFNAARAARLGIPYAGLRPRRRLSRLSEAIADRFWLILAVRQRLRSWLGGLFGHAGTKGVTRGT